MRPKRWPEPDEAIRYALDLVSLTEDRPEVLAFYRETFDGHPVRFMSYDDLRKKGTPLDKASLAALGLNSRVKLSAEFFATLNEGGRADPIDAACKIGLAIHTAMSSARDLRKMADYGVEAVRFWASNGNAGHCQRAGSLDRQVLPLDRAEILPLTDCDRPGTCACNLLAHFDL